MPGPLRQLTGGYLYDARIVDGLRERGWRVGAIDLRARHWPLDLPAGRRLHAALQQHPWSAVVVDELAHPALVAALLGGGRWRGAGAWAGEGVARGAARELARGVGVRAGTQLGAPAKTPLAVAGRPAPLVLLVHHLRCSEPAPWPTRDAARLVEGIALRAADLVVCTSATTAATVRPLVRAGVAVEVVRPGWDTHAFTPLPRGKNACGTVQFAGEDAAPALCGVPREGLRPPGAGLRLLLVGHWTPRKGILDALAALARTSPGVTLDLVGEQDRAPAYAARVWAALAEPALAGRVRVHGRVQAEALAALYDAADALLLPSTHEGYGMVLAEALAAGLPIVATRVGAVPEVVRDGAEAVLVAPGDVTALAAAIEQLARDPDERRRRAALARQRAAALPRWQESIERFDALLGRLVSGG